MNLNYTITERDYREFNMYVAFTKTIRKKIIILFIFALILFAIGYSKPDRFSPTVYFAILISYCLLYFGIYHFYAFSSPSRLRKNSTVLGNKTANFNEENIHITEELISGEISYKAFSSIESSKTAYYLFAESNQALIIPKRVFSSKDEELKFISLIESKIK